MMKSGYCTIMWNGRDQAQAKWTTIKHSKSWPSPIESDIVYIVGFKGSPPIWISSGKANNKFQQALLSVRLTESSIQWKASRISQQKIISQQCNIRLHVYLMIRQKTVTAWLASSDSTVIFTRHCAFGFPLILVFAKFF